MPKAYQGNQPYIFVSYAHKDDNVVGPIIDALQAAGFRVWFDEGIEAGHEWANDIASHEKRCTAFLAFISRNSIESENCLDEISYAKNFRKPSILCFLEDQIELPDGLELQTGRFQRLFRSRFDSQEAMVHQLEKNGLLASCRDMTRVERVTRQDADIKPEPLSDHIVSKEIEEFVEASIQHSDYDACAAFDAASKTYPNAKHKTRSTSPRSSSYGFWAICERVFDDGLSAVFGITLELSYSFIGAYAFKHIIENVDSGLNRFLLMLIPHVAIALIIGVVYNVSICSFETMFLTMTCCIVSSLIAVFVGCSITEMGVTILSEFLLSAGLNVVPLILALIVEFVVSLI